MHTPSIPRRTLAATIALATGISLAACGTNSTEDTAPTETTTSEAAPKRASLVNPPRWTKSDEIPIMAEKGCSPGFESYAEGIINYFTDFHGGDYAGFDIAFQEGPASPRGHKTCEITVDGLEISGTNGGDLNNATILVEALPEGLNNYDKKISRQAFAEKASMRENGDITSLNGLSDLVDDAIQYANTHDMIEGSKVSEEKQDVVMELSNPTATTALSMYILLPSYPNDTDLELETPDDTMEANGFAVVTTDDEQRTDTQRSAAEALAFVLSIGVGNNGFGQNPDNYFRIKSQP